MRSLLRNFSYGAHIVKGAFDRIARLAAPPESAVAAAAQPESQGYRVLAVAAGPRGQLAWAGMIALTDPPRLDARALIAELIGCSAVFALILDLVKTQLISRLGVAQ